MQKHDCRDWPGVGQNGGGGNAQNIPGSIASPSQFSAPQNQTFPNGNGETLIGVQAKKTWENYFKFLEVIAANTAAITSSLDATNKLLVELGTKLQSMEDTMTVTKAKVEPENGS